MKISKFLNNISAINFRNKMTPLNWFLLAGLLIFLLFFRESLIKIILVIVFAPFTRVTIRYSKAVPHVSLASNTPLSVFMGILFGPVFGFFYGLLMGCYAYFINGYVKLNHIITIILAAVSAVLGGVYKIFFDNYGTELGFIIGNVDTFILAYTLALITRIFIGWFAFFQTDFFERITHSLGQFISQLFFFMPVLKILYDYLVPLI